MYWYVPLGENDTRELYLNFTMADWSNDLPDAVCFGLNNGSVCTSLRARNLEMSNLNISNVSFITINDMLCNATGTCWTLTNLSSGGSGNANESFNQSLTDTLYLTINGHELNGTNHTGNLSANRVVKDSGTNYLGEFMDSIIDQLYIIIDDLVGQAHTHDQYLNTSNNVQFNSTMTNEIYFDAEHNVTIYKENDYMVFEVTVT
jgi:hypothetical protein